MEVVFPNHDVKKHSFSFHITVRTEIRCICQGFYAQMQNVIP